MRLMVRAVGFELTEALNEYVTKRATSAMGRHADRLGEVQVRLSDVNGPKGGADKRCHVVAALHGGRDVIVEETHEDMYAAVDVALDRAGFAVKRRIERAAEPVLTR